MLRNYVKIAFRKLSKDRQFAFLNLTGLSTGLACTLLIFLWVNDELSIDKFHQKDSQLYRVLGNVPLENELRTMEQTPYPLGAALVGQMPEVERAVSVNYGMDWFAGKGVASVGQNLDQRPIALIAGSLLPTVGAAEARGPPDRHTSFGFGDPIQL